MNEPKIDWFTSVIDSQVFENLLSLFELVAYIATIGGIIAIAISIKQFKKDIEKTNYELDFRKKEYSMKVLSDFSEKIIPMIDDFYKCFNEELSNLSEDEKAELNSDSIKKNEIYVNLKAHYNVIPIFNELERISSYIRYDMVDIEVLYDPISNLILRFTRENKDVFSAITQSSPYANLNYVIDSWDSQKKLDILEKRQNEILEEIDKIKKVKDT